MWGIYFLSVWIRMLYFDWCTYTHYDNVSHNFFQAFHSSIHRDLFQIFYWLLFVTQSLVIRLRQWQCSKAFIRVLLYIFPPNSKFHSQTNIFNLLSNNILNFFYIEALQCLPINTSIAHIQRLHFTFVNLLKWFCVL